MDYWRLISSCLRSSVVGLSQTHPARIATRKHKPLHPRIPDGVSHQPFIRTNHYIQRLGIIYKIYRLQSGILITDRANGFLCSIRVGKRNCLSSANNFRSSTYNETSTKWSLISFFTEGLVHTFSSILLQFTQAHPVKSINTGLFCSRAI